VIGASRATVTRPNRPRDAATLLGVALALSLAACAPRRIDIPSDAGMPFPDAQRIHDSISAACRDIRTFTAEIALGGRAGDQPLRGVTLSAAFRRPDGMVLEMLAQFGTVFVFGATGGESTLVLREDRRVLRGAPPGKVLEALIGLDLSPAELHAILTGCVVAEPRVTSGRLHANGWASIALADGTVLYLDPSRGGWRLREARRGSLEVEYSEWRQGSVVPSVVRLLASTPVPVDLRATLSQVETNMPLEDSLFLIPVRDERPMTLEELRDSGPLRDD
jgi:hypothetical protein